MLGKWPSCMCSVSKTTALYSDFTVSSQCIRTPCTKCPSVIKFCWRLNLLQNKASYNEEKKLYELWNHCIFTGLIQLINTAVLLLKNLCKILEG